MGGLYTATCGAETIDPTKDTNFSRAILFGFAEPFTFMGVRATYSINGQANMVFGLNNGWDSIRDTERRKTTELGITYTVTPELSVAVMEYNGSQRAADRTAYGPESIRNLLDIVATYSYSDTMTFIFVYDYGKQPKALLPDGSYGGAIWQGSALYGNYKFNDAWLISLRGEIFEDKNGYRTGVVQTWKEVTLSLAYSPIKDLTIRAETRRDFSSNSSFVNSNGIGTSSNNQSYALEAFYQIGI